MSETARELTVRQYAQQEGIVIQTAYRRVWEGKVNAKQVFGRWLISAEEQDAKTENPGRYNKLFGEIHRLVTGQVK